MADITADVMDARTDVRTKASWQRGASCGKVSGSSHVEAFWTLMRHWMNHARNTVLASNSQSKDLLKRSSVFNCSCWRCKLMNVKKLPALYLVHCCLMISYYLKIISLHIIVSHYITGQWQTQSQTNMFRAAWAAEIPTFGVHIQSIHRIIFDSRRRVPVNIWSQAIYQRNFLDQIWGRLVAIYGSTATVRWGLYTFRYNFPKLFRYESVWKNSQKSSKGDGHQTCSPAIFASAYQQSNR